MGYLIAIAIGVIIALIVVNCMKGELKSVHMQHEAANYIKQGSFKVEEKQDRFMYKKLEKTKKEQPQPQQKS